MPFRPLFVASLRKDRLTRSEGIVKNPSGQLGVLVAGVRSPLGEATTTGSRMTTGGGAAENELTLPDESAGGEPGVQLRFSTLRGNG